MERFALSNYTVVTSRALLPALAASSKREQLALIEYYVALHSHRFIGNSVSTFSALAMLERRHRGQWAAYYNLGRGRATDCLRGA